MTTSGWRCGHGGHRGRKGLRRIHRRSRGQFRGVDTVRAPQQVQDLVVTEPGRIGIGAGARRRIAACRSWRPGRRRRSRKQKTVTAARTPDCPTGKLIPGPQWFAAGARNLNGHSGPSGEPSRSLNGIGGSRRPVGSCRAGFFLPGGSNCYTGSDSRSVDIPLHRPVARTRRR